MIALSLTRPGVRGRPAGEEDEDRRGHAVAEGEEEEGRRLLQDELVDDERRAPDRRHEDEGGIGEERLAARHVRGAHGRRMIRARRSPAVIITSP